MRWLQGKSGARAGWVQAPRAIELEIRTVWQEDELPDELKAAPGWTSFTLSPESQVWVDSMAEVVDGGNAVYGRPNATVPTSHRSLATEPPPAIYPVHTPPPRARVQVQPSAPRHQPMPEIADSPSVVPRVTPPTPVRTLPKRVSMPDIGAPELRPAPHSDSVMPDIGSVEPHSTQAPSREMPDIGSPPAHAVAPSHATMPEIGTSDPCQPQTAQASMPDIGARESHATQPNHVAMPDVGTPGSLPTYGGLAGTPETGSPKPRQPRPAAAAMPEIGDDEETSPHPKPLMPEIG